VEQTLAQNPETDDRTYDFCRSPQRFLTDLALAESPIARFKVNDEPFAVVSSPELFHAVMAGNMEDFEKGPLVAIPRTSFGESIFTADRQAWIDQRTYIAPYFSRRRISDLSRLFAALVDRQIERWEGLPEGETVDVLAAVKRLSFDIVRIGLIGIEDPILAEDLRIAISKVDDVESIRVYYMAQRLPGFGTLVPKFSINEHLDRVAYAMADERLSGTTDSDDLVGAALRDPEFRKLAHDAQRKIVRDLMASMVTAGYVTAGETMFWALYLLARHPESQARARAEIRASSAGPDGRPDFRSLPYLAAVLNENLRLYPTAWFLGRMARRTVQVGDVTIPEGTRLVCSPFVLHRMPAYWPDPEVFRPERFLPGATRVTRAFQPFGIGIRACLGQAMIGMEMSTLVGAVLSRFDVELASAEPIALSAAFSLRPRGRVLFRLRRS
jgi:cytochrome P450